MSATIVRNDAITLLPEEQHLCVPGIGVERPPVSEHDGLPATPVLVKKRGAIFGADRRHGHDSSGNNDKPKTARESATPGAVMTADAMQSVHWTMVLRAEVGSAIGRHVDFGPRRAPADGGRRLRFLPAALSIRPSTANCDHPC